MSSLLTRTIDRTPIQIVTIDGQPYNAYSVETQHALERIKGTARLRLPSPPASEIALRDRWLNKPIEVQIGYEETGGAYRVFFGRITRLHREIDANGYVVEINATGGAARLDFPEPTDLVFPGGSTLYNIIRSICELRGLTAYGGQLVLYPDGVTEVTLGGVEFVDNGDVIIPRHTSPLQWIANALRLFGYYCCDLPDGMFWWGRVTGIPSLAPSDVIREGENAFSLSRDDDLSRMVTWWDVEGASYTDADGIAVAVRSFPAVVPYEPKLDPPGWTRDTVRDPLLVTQALADAARNVAEINRAAPYEEERWVWLGAPNVYPGHVVELTSERLDLTAERRWAMSVDHSSSTRGIRSTFTGWAGAGAAMPAGDDALTISVFTDPRHIGDEYLSHYAHPSAQGKTITFDIVVPDTYTAMVLTGWAHGTNSYLSGGSVVTDGNVSKIEVWQGGDKPAGSAALPAMPENLSKKYPYGTPLPADWQKYWTAFRLSVPGRLTPGPATVKLLSGKYGSGSYDDYEVRLLDLVVTGAGSPSLPGGA